MKQNKSMMKSSLYALSVQRKQTKANLILLLVFALLSFSSLSLKAQQGKKVFIAFYNQENLFDTIDDPLTDDNEFLPLGKYQWNTERYKNKVSHMAQVISAMNDHKGPDILGMCEVESDLVLRDLSLKLEVNQVLYKYLFFDGPDERGIDVALLYKPQWVKSATAMQFNIDPNGIGGDKTRPLLMADLTLKNGSRLVVFVNHWPSRREGQEASEYKRIFVASTLKHITDSLLRVDPMVNVLVMGDFNDMPSDQSIQSIMLAKSKPQEVKLTEFYNPLTEFASVGQGSYHYKGNWELIDQILLNRNLVQGRNKLMYINAGIFKEDWMLETDERFAGNPKRTFAGSKYLNGYSDHLPVFVELGSR